MSGAWHEGHVMGGYLNPACASCRREGARERLQANPWTRRWPNSKGKGEVYVRLDDALDEVASEAPSGGLDPAWFAARVLHEYRHPDRAGALGSGICDCVARGRSVARRLSATPGQGDSDE